MKIKGKKIFGGKVEGEAIVQQELFSFFGDVNRETGIINVGTNAGKSFKDKILVFPKGKGSTLAPYVAINCVENGVAPKAILCQKADGVIALVGIMARIPAVDQFDKDIMKVVKTGDYLKVDADKGIVEIIEKQG
jgi:phosphomecalonate degydratase small subunit